MFWGISTSGVLRAMEEERSKGLYTIGFTSDRACPMTKRSNLCIAAPPTETPTIQKAHMLAGHIVSGLAEATLYPPP